MTFALYDETWIKRSTSYLATASAILSAPSTWTSSRSKFLEPSESLPSSRLQNVLGRVHSPNEIVDHVRMSDTLLERLCISEIVFLKNNSAKSPWMRVFNPTMNTTRPKSPATFRCRFAISSRKGTITVHPCRAVPPNISL